MSFLDRLALLAVIVIWALHFVVAKTALDQFPPLFMVTVRLVVVAVILSPFLFKRQRPSLKVMAGFAFGLGICHYGLLFGGLAGVDAGPAAIATQLQVPFGLILAALFFRERLSIAQGIGIVSAFIGVWLLAGESRVATSLGSLLLVIGSSLAIAAVNILIKRVGPVNGFVFNAWVAFLAAPVIGAASWTFEDGQIAALLSADWQVWASILYSAIVVSLLSWSLWYHLIAKYEVGRIVPSVLLIPAFAVVFAAVFRGEPVTWEIVVGGLLTVAGVAVINLPGLRKKLA